MKNINSTILNEISVFLQMYFKSEGTEYFYSLLRDAVEANSVKPEEVEENNEDKTVAYNSGSEVRSEVDKILSFVQDKIEDESYQKLVLSISLLMVYKGEYEIAEELIENLYKNQSSILPEINAEILLLQSKIAWNQQDWDESESKCNEAKSFFRKIENLPGISNCENMLGNIAGEKGHVLEAEQHYQKGFEYAVSSGNLELKAMFCVNLGIVADMRGDIGMSEQHYSNAVIYYKHLNNEFQVARLNHNLGMLSVKKEDYITSFKYFDNSIKIAHKNEYNSTYAISLAAKAFAFLQIGEYNLANKFADKAFESAIRIDDRLTIAEVYRVKGLVQKAQKNFALAEEYLEISRQLNEDFYNEYNTAEISLELAKLYTELNEKTRSSEMLNDARNYYNTQRINPAIYNGIS